MSAPHADEEPNLPTRGELHPRAHPAVDERAVEAGGCFEDDRLFFGDGPDEPDGVAAHVDGSAAAGFVVESEVGERPVRAKGCLDVLDLTDFAASDDIANPVDERVIAKVHRLRDDQVGSLRGPEHAFDFCRVGGEGLFAQDVLAALRWP